MEMSELIKHVELMLKTLAEAKQYAKESIDYYENCTADFNHKLRWRYLHNVILKNYKSLDMLKTSPESNTSEE